MNTRDTLICIVLISLTLYACASVAAVGGELRAGILAAIVFPVLLLVGIVISRKLLKNKES